MFSLFLLNPPRCNPTHVDEEEKGKCHQPPFLALPITTELTEVRKPDSVLAPHAIYC